MSESDNLSSAKTKAEQNALRNAQEKIGVYCLRLSKRILAKKFQGLRKGIVTKFLAFNLCLLISDTLTLPTPKGGGFLGSLNSVEVSPYSLTCALIPNGNAKLPLPCYPKASGYFYSYIALLNASSS